MTTPHTLQNVHVWDASMREHRPEFAALLAKATSARQQRDSVRLDSLLDARSPDAVEISKTMDKLMRGDMQQLDTADECRLLDESLKTAVRVFMSSTYEDVLWERDTFIHDVFPFMRQFCSRLGLDWETVDMRTSMADLSKPLQSLAEIRKKELESCIAESAGPALFAILGDRYGPRPLPPNIPQLEYTLIRQHITKSNLQSHIASHSDQLRSIKLPYPKPQTYTPSIPSFIRPETVSNPEGLIRRWWEYDENAAPPAWVLREIVEDDLDKWWEEEAEVERILRVGVRKGWTILGEKRREEFEWSVIEEEVTNALQLAADVENKVICFKREIFNILQHIHHPFAPTFIDLHTRHHPDPNRERPLLDVEAHERKTAFHQSVPIQKWYSVEWHRRFGFLPVSDGETRSHGDYVRSFTDDFTNIMCESILKNYAHLRPSLSTYQRHFEAEGETAVEVLSHHKRAHLLSRGFVGRAKLIDSILAEVVMGGGAGVVLSGDSGVGKSALLAHIGTVIPRHRSDAVVVMRFAGLTTGSSDGFLLMRSVVRQLCSVFLGMASGEGVEGQTARVKEVMEIVNTQGADGGATVPFGGLERQLGVVLTALSPRPVYLIIDGLDRLLQSSEYQQLFWLPRNIPQNLHLILSCRPHTPPIGPVEPIPPPVQEYLSLLQPRSFPSLPAPRTSTMSSSSSERRRSSASKPLRRSSAATPPPPPRRASTATATATLGLIAVIPSARQESTPPPLTPPLTPTSTEFRFRSSSRTSAITPISIPPLSDDDITLLLRSLQKESRRRTVGENQWSYLMAHAQLVRTPLFVKLLWQVSARHWRSLEVAPGEKEALPERTEEGKGKKVGVWMKGVFKKGKGDAALKNGKVVLPQRKQLSRSVEGMLGRLFDRCEREVGEVFVAAAVALLTCAKSGLSTTELEDLLSLDDAVLGSVSENGMPSVPRVPSSCWVRLRAELADLLEEHMVLGTKVWKWGTTIVERIARERYARYDHELWKWHSLLADYFDGHWSYAAKRFTSSIDSAIPPQWADRLVKSQPTMHPGNHLNHRRLSCLSYHQLQAAKYAASSVREQRTIDVRQLPTPPATPTTPTISSSPQMLDRCTPPKRPKKPEAYLSDAEEGFLDWENLVAVLKAGYYDDVVKDLSVAIELRKGESVGLDVKGEERWKELPDLLTFLKRLAGKIIEAPGRVVELASGLPGSCMVGRRAREYLLTRPDEMWIEDLSEPISGGAVVATLWRKGGMPKISGVEVGEGRVIVVGTDTSASSVDGDREQEEAVVMGWEFAEGVSVKFVGEARLPAALPLSSAGWKWTPPRCCMSRDGKFLAVYGQLSVAVLSCVDLTVRCILGLNADAYVNGSELTFLDWVENPYHASTPVRRIVAVVEERLGGRGRIVEWKFEPELPFLESTPTPGRRSPGKGPAKLGALEPTKVIRTFEGWAVGICTETLGVRKLVNGRWRFEFSALFATRGTNFPTAELRSIALDDGDSAFSGDDASDMTFESRSTPLFAMARDKRRCLLQPEDDPERFWLMNIWDGKRLAPLDVHPNRVTQIFLSANARHAGITFRDSDEILVYELQKSEETQEDDSGPSVTYSWVYSHALSGENDREPGTLVLSMGRKSMVAFDRRKKRAVTRGAGDVLLVWEIERMDGSDKDNRRLQSHYHQLMPPLKRHSQLVPTFAPLLLDGKMTWVSHVPGLRNPRLISSEGIINLTGEDFDDAASIIGMDTDVHLGHALLATQDGKIRWMTIEPAGHVSEVVQSDIPQEEQDTFCVKVLDWLDTDEGEDVVVFATGHDGGKLNIWQWDIGNGGVPAVVKELRGPEGRIELISTSTDGWATAAVVADLGIMIWDRETDVIRVVYDERDFDEAFRDEAGWNAVSNWTRVVSLAVDQSGNGPIVVAAGYQSGVVRIYAVHEEGTLIREFSLPPPRLTDAPYYGAIAVDIQHADEGSTVVFATNGHAIHMIDLSTGASSTRSLSPDGSPVAGRIWVRHEEAEDEGSSTTVIITNHMGRVQILRLRGHDEFTYGNLLSEPAVCVTWGGEDEDEVVEEEDRAEVEESYEDVTITSEEENGVEELGEACAVKVETVEEAIPSKPGRTVTFAADSKMVEIMAHTDDDGDESSEDEDDGEVDVFEVFRQMSLARRRLASVGGVAQGTAVSLPVAGKYTIWAEVGVADSFKGRVVASVKGDEIRSFHIDDLSDVVRRCRGADRVMIRVGTLAADVPVREVAVSLGVEGGGDFDGFGFMVRELRFQLM
ncbi:hypothetical protein HDV00_005464 [Rhizophlyctis rosea]|nr:hypothetical protein HDV00_005464 [Rhizophlyctis rosea]